MCASGIGLPDIGFSDIGKSNAIVSAIKINGAVKKLPLKKNRLDREV